MKAGRNQVLGQVRVNVDGQHYETDGKSSIELGGMKRDAVAGDYQAGAFRESTEPSKVECSILLKPGVSLEAIRNARDVTLSIEADTGHHYVVRNAYSAEPPSLSTDEGKAKCVFQGPPAEEMTFG